MSAYKIGVLNGDAIGPEIVASSVEVLKAAVKRYGDGIEFEYVYLPIGWEGIKRCNDPVPELTKKGLRDVDAWIMGPHDNVSYPDDMRKDRNPSGELRHTFDLYSNIRPSHAMPGCESLVGDADIIILRENSEGFLSDRNMYQGVGEFMVTPDVAITTGVFTRRATARIARQAFELAEKRRKKVTIVHKANVIRLSFGLFKNICYEVARDYPDVEVNDMHIDAFTAHLVRNAQQFDIVVTENLFGDIISDLAGELFGSLGLSASINTNGTQVMAQAAHGAAPDIGGKNVCNPTSMLLSVAMMLDWMGFHHDDVKMGKLGKTINDAVIATLKNGNKTRDLGGTASTTEFTAEVIDNL